ncbi:MAG TPA: ABC transporter ATP-binding protein [Halanaerobiales bacterium]|nr:ABC transporter ATP-binding protein [Halanaerobiales bacterium]
MFKLNNVKYKDILKVNNLELEENKITCIVGKSGGGKTTFLKLLNNMISPSSGIIKFKGKNIVDYDPVELRREIPMLPQNPVVFSGTIKDNFDLALKYAELKTKSKKAYKEILGKVGLEEQKLDKIAEDLSGGEKQRISLARILLLEPNILLLDEPSSALDEKTEKLIIDTVVNYIKRKNGTLIMVTHSTKIAKEYGDEIVTINHGKIDKSN